MAFKGDEERREEEAVGWNRLWKEEAQSSLGSSLELASGKGEREVGKASHRTQGWVAGFQEKEPWEMLRAKGLQREARGSFKFSVKALLVLEGS